MGEPALSRTELVVDEVEDRDNWLLVDLGAHADRDGVDIPTRCCQGGQHDEILAAVEAISADLRVLDSLGQTNEWTAGTGRVAEGVARQARGIVLLA